MIRIDRGPEPEALVLARDEHLARALFRGGPPSEIHGYEIARDMLTERQIYKCAYCELTFRGEAAPVEHYRPKARADDIDWTCLAPKKHPGEVDREDDERFARGLPPIDDGFERVRWTSRPGYWWLAWTWENLVFGCTSCNSAGVKGTRFPQARAASALRTHQAPPGEEYPLLLDPADAFEDPLDHIQFRWVHNRWKPLPREGSPRGAWTIGLLRLGSSHGLLTAYDTRVRHLDRCVRALDAARERRDEHAIRTEWEAVLREVLDSKEPLLGLTYDWLNARYVESWRADLGLVLAKPVLRVPDLDPAPPPNPAVAPLSKLDGLPESLCDHVRVARSFRVKTGSRFEPSREQKPLQELVADVLAHRPDVTDEELAALLRRKPATIRKHRR